MKVENKRTKKGLRDFNTPNEKKKKQKKMEIKERIMDRALNAQVLRKQ